MNSMAKPLTGSSAAGAGSNAHPCPERHRPMRTEAPMRTHHQRWTMHRYLRDERGAVTVEFTVLVPFFVFLMVFFADATVVYLTHSEMFNAAREVSRRASTGEIRTLSEAEAYASDKLLLGARTYFLNVDFSGKDKTVRIGIPLSDAAIFGTFLRPILGRELVAIANVSEEPRI
jgi:Flp pilus assembly pilin Flp